MPFEKGKSGNPEGRRIEKPFQDALRMELAAAGKDHKALRVIARRLIEIAGAVDNKEALGAIKELADRTDGKSAAQVALTGEDGGALTIEIKRFAG